MEKKKTFEEKQAMLAKIVEQLDKDKDLTLEQTAALYAEGKKLILELNEELKTLKDSITNDIILDK